MKIIKNIAAVVALVFGVATTAIAQTVEDKYPYNFITVQGGAQATLTHYKFSDLITPQVALSAGHYFNSKVGTRLHLQGWEVKGGFKPEYCSFVPTSVGYKFKAITGDIDVLLNMTNIINPNRANDLFDWVLLAGIGMNYAWDFEQFYDIMSLSNARYYLDDPDMWNTKHSTFNGRLGTQFNVNLSRSFAVGLELDANFKNDEFNLKRNSNPDWQLQAFLGLTYKFGGRKKSPVPVIEPVVQDVADYNQAEVAMSVPVAEEKKPVAPVVKDEPLKETFYYKIRLSDPEPESKLNEIADWCKRYTNKKLTVKGYADKDTGTPKVNARYAKARAEKVAKALRERGVPESQLEVSSYGDTVQPFANNDDNRCVIVVGE